MAVALVNAQFDNDTSTTSQTTTVLKPTGLVAGDVMVAFVRSRTAITGAPSGWTGPLVSDTSVNGLTYAYIKVAVAGDLLSSNYVWTQTTASGRIAGVILAYRGVSITTPQDVTTLLYTGTNGGTVIKDDGITTVSANCRIVAGWFWNGDGNANTGTMNAGFASRVDSQFTGGGRQNLLVGDMTKAVAGATGAINSAITATTILLRSSVVFALRPRAGAITQTCAATETVTGKKKIARAITQTAACTEAVAGRKRMARTITEIAASTETVSGRKRVARTVAEIAAAIEAVTGKKRSSGAITETAAAIETVTGRRSHGGSVTAVATCTETVAGHKRGVAAVTTAGNVVTVLVGRKGALGAVTAICSAVETVAGSVPFGPPRDITVTDQLQPPNTADAIQPGGLVDAIAAPSTSDTLGESPWRSQLKEATYR